MEAKRVPNLFMSLYRLARADNYDTAKWRDILTGIHRKSAESPSIRDLCLLYYSLVKGSTDRDISEMEISYKDRRTLQSVGPFSLRDVADAYTSSVSRLMKFMNTKQLAMVSKSLLMLNKLNAACCDLILSKVSSNMKITTRSFSNIVLTLSESKHVSSDAIERVIAQNIELLEDMNRVDLLYILKAVSTHKIANEKILKVISERLDFYAEEMKPAELMGTLHALYKLDWNGHIVANKLYFRLQSLLDKFNTSDIVFISKYLTHFGIKGLRDFFDHHLIPLFHKLHEGHPLVTKTPSGGIEFSDPPGAFADEVLLFYHYCLKAGATTFPKLIPKVLDILEGYHWHLLFSVLLNYQKNNDYAPGRVRSFTKGGPNSLGDFDSETDGYAELLLDSVASFREFIATHELDAKYLSSVTRSLIECGVDNDALYSEILKPIDSQNCPTDCVVDILFALHTIDSEPFNGEYEKLLTRTAEESELLDHSHVVSFLSCVLFRGIEPLPRLISAFKSIFQFGESQEVPWQIGSKPQKNSGVGTRRINVPDQSLEYLLYTFAFGAGYGDAISGLRPQIRALFISVKTFARDDILKVFLYCVENTDKELYRSLNGAPGFRPPGAVKVEVIPANAPQTALTEFGATELVLVKVDGAVFYGPGYLVSGTRDVYLPLGPVEHWHSLARNALTAVLRTAGYTPHSLNV